MTGRDALLALYFKYKNNWNDIFAAISNKEIVSEDDFYNYVTKKYDPDDFITLIDKEYPDDLKHTYRPPFVIFKYDLEIIKNKISLAHIAFVTPESYNSRQTFSSLLNAQPFVELDKDEEKPLPLHLTKEEDEQ